MASVDKKYHVKVRSRRHLTASVTTQSARREGEPGGRCAGAAQASVAAAVPHAPAAARARQRAQLDARHLRVRAEAADVVLGLIVFDSDVCHFATVNYLLYVKSSTN